MDDNNNLEAHLFRYFINNDLVFVEKQNISFLPENVTKDVKNNHVEFSVNKLDDVLKFILETKNVKVEEYVLYENYENTNSNKEKLFENQKYVLYRSGHSKDYNDFSDINLVSSTICGIELFSHNIANDFGYPLESKCLEFTHVFSYLKNEVVYYTFYYDDDLLSVTFSLYAAYNCNEIIYNEKRWESIFNSWGAKSVWIKTKLIDTYFKTTFLKSYFSINNFCLVNLNDYDLVDFHTQTKQGLRLLTQWLKMPLVSQADIEKRLDLTEYFHNTNINLSRFVDLKRIIIRIQNKKITIDEITTLYQVIKVLPLLIEKIVENNNPTPLVTQEILNPLYSIQEHLYGLSQKIEEEIDIDNAEIRLTNEEPFKSLKEKKQELETDMQLELAMIQKEFSNVKIHQGVFKTTKKEWNNSTKYSIISLNKTGVTFTTKHLSEINKNLEIWKNQLQKAIKYKLDALKERLNQEITQLEIYNYIISQIDIYKAFSLKCKTPGYSRPQFIQKDNANLKYTIENMWHPAIKHDPIKNSIVFDKNMCVLTGPNMGGKSTFIKTISIISLYAQIGCYVPASKAILPIFERIIMRIGAHDISSQRMSTFMVEMIDLNIICRNNKFSLILIDELGRGTSATDGISIILAVKEHLEKTNNFTIITTHFNNISETENTISLQMGVHDGIFTYKVENGMCDNSFGLRIAELAHFPKEVLDNISNLLNK